MFMLFTLFAIQKLRLADEKSGKKVSYSEASIFGSYYAYWERNSQKNSQKKT